MILLDTNAVIWSLTSHPRSRPLLDSGEKLRVSPVSVLELQFLREVGRVPEPAAGFYATVAEFPNWRVDSPSSESLFRAALDFGWTRDPFDRLLVAHAALRRWRLATGDRRLLNRLEHTIPL